MRPSRKPVPAGCEASSGDDSRFFRYEKKSVRRHLGLLLDREKRKRPVLGHNMTC